MNTIYCHFSKPCEVRKRPFQAADRTSNERKLTGDKLWITEVRTSIQVSHLYLRALSEGEALTTRSAGNIVRAEVNRTGASSAVRSCDYCGCGILSDRIRMRQAGRRERCFRCAHRIIPSLQGLRPLRRFAAIP